MNTPQKERFVGYIWNSGVKEKDIPLQVDDNHPMPIPERTVVITDLQDIRKFSWKKILTESMNYRPGEIPAEQVKLWGLRRMDKVVVDEDGTILSVFGITDPEKSRSRPIVDIEDPNAMGSDFGDVILAVDAILRDLSLRVFCLRAPLTYGSRLMIAGRGWTGKTSLIRKLYQGLLRLAKVRRNMYVMLLQVADHREDATKYKEVFEIEPVENSLFLQSPGSDKHRANVQLFEASLQLAWRYVELGRDVAWGADSYSRILNSLSAYEASKDDKYGSWLLADTNKSASYLTGGFTRAALNKAQQAFTMGGKFDNGATLTVIASVLLPDPDNRASESQFAIESLHSLPTAVWGLTSAEGAPYPKIDLDLTRVREGDDFIPKPHREDMNEANSVMIRPDPEDEDEKESRPDRFTRGKRGGTPKDPAKHRNLIGYAYGKPIPKYTWTLDQDLQGAIAKYYPPKEDKDLKSVSA